MKKTIYFLILIAFSSCAIVKPLNTSKDTLVWQEDFSKPSFEITQNFLYTKHSYTDSTMVSIENDGLHLKAERLDTPIVVHKWGKSQLCYWKIGWVNYQKHFNTVKYGTFVFRFIPPSTKHNFAAIWFLKHPHAPKEMQFKAKIDSLDGKLLKLKESPPYPLKINYWLLDSERNPLGRLIQSYDSLTNTITLKEKIDYSDSVLYISSDHIIPEIDLMEVVKEKLTTNIHYGYTPHKYHKHSLGAIEIVPIVKGAEYEMAVRFSKKKTEYYINGYKYYETKIGLSEEPLYFILNNGITWDIIEGVQEDFIIKSIKYYK